MTASPLPFPADLSGDPFRQMLGRSLLPMERVEIVSGDVRNILGDAVVWDSQSGSLLLTDIQKSQLWDLDQTGRLKVSKAPEHIGSFAPRESGGIVVPFATGFAFWNPETGQPDDIVSFEAHLSQTRLNDGGTHRQGRFHGGGMDKRDGKPTSLLCPRSLRTHIPERYLLLV